MKINLPQRPNANDVANPTFLARHTETVTAALKKNISYGDNMAGALMTLSMAHGVPLLVKNPLPQSAKPIGVEVKNCDTQFNPDISLSATATINGVLTTAPIGYVYLTALYPFVPSFLGPISRLRSNGLSIATGTTTNVCTTPSLPLGPGDWQVQGFVGFESTGAATLALRAGVSKAGNTPPATDSMAVPTGGEVLLAEDISSLSPGGAGGDYTFSITPYRVPVAIGATLPLFLVARTIIAAGAAPVVYGSMEARLMGPPAGTTANVTLFLVGA